MNKLKDSIPLCSMKMICLTNQTQLCDKSRIFAHNAEKILSTQTAYVYKSDLGSLRIKQTYTQKTEDG